MSERELLYLAVFQACLVKLSHKLNIAVGNCTLHLLILNISDFVYLLHNQTACMQHVSYRPIYGAVPRAYKET